MSGRMGLVLSGGAARGAYEAGVVLHLVEEVARDLGRPLPLDILCGTSVGAINACLLAAFADEPVGRGRRLAAHWRGLRMSDVVHPDGRGIWASVRGLFKSQRSPREQDERRGGILDPKGIEQLVERSVPFRRISENIQAGHLSALTVSATHVGSGRKTVFIEQGDGPRYSAGDPTVLGVQTSMRAEHALASAAIPFLFPAVRIDGEFYCDGGLRQNVPLAPALRLGASSLLVVSPRHLTAKPPRAVEQDREQDFPGPFFLLGKALSSLLLDRIDNDLVQLERINKVLRAGINQYGPSFLDTINRELGVPAQGPRMRPVQTVTISASQDIGVLAAEYVRSPLFAKRLSPVAGKIVRRIGELSADADLLSYLLFDGEFAAQLIELGRADARARHSELCALFADVTDEAQVAA